uniref:PLAT domain-containing protein n=1 Tax=Angiostrongylus cantonensis TaxID=6313 RepID=A0A158P6F7_ANGCA
MGRSLGLDVVPSKQVFFVLNGKGRFYRTLLHPFRLPPMETLLHEVSEGLQVAIFRLYSMKGSRISSVNEILNLSPPKVLACTRIERPYLGTVMLPNIDTHRSDTKAPHKPMVPASEKVVAKTEDTDSGMANSISSRMTETPKIEDDHEFAFNEEIERHLREAEKQLIPEDDESSEEISYSVRRPETNSSSSIMSPRKHQDIPQKQEERSLEEELPSTAGTSKSDVRSEAERKAELIMEKKMEEIREDEILSRNGSSDVEEILISDDDVNNETMVALDKTSVCEDASPILRNESESDKEEILASDNEVDLDSQRRSNLSTSFRNHVDSSSLNDEKKAQTSRSDNDEELNEEINKPSGATRAVDSDREEILPSDDEELNNRNKAAITIQAAFRGYQAREKVKMVHFTEQNNPSNANVTDIEEPRQQEVTEQEITYTISITTGNRWGAETEANLYIQMFGDEQTSRRFYLQQEVDWLQSGETRFRQRHMDLFHVETENLGTIHQVIIGHEAEGYGAGIFIDYVLITENLVDGRQFVCYCSKWFDSGQVDGKIERILSVSAFYYLDSAPDKSVISQGRWEVILHNGMEDGTGGTTSNLIIIGYGTKGSSVMHIGNDKTMLAVPDTTLIQMDFGAIGDLLKIRFEIDGAGEQPDYYIEWAELRDLDTDERTTVRYVLQCHKRTLTRHPRYIDAVLVLLNGWTLPVHERNDRKHSVKSASFDRVNNRCKEYSFKVECVHLGRINCIKIIGNFTEKGQAILEGFSVLQELWDKHVGNVQTAGGVSFIERNNV